MGIKDQYITAGQSHLFTGFDELSTEDQQVLLQNLEAVSARVSPQKLVDDCQKAIKLAEENSKDTQAIEPLPQTSYESIIDNEEAESRYFNLGMEALKRNEVGVILLAGGQGTRLGSSQPKGCYDIGLPSNKSLFQIQAERISCLQNLVGGDCTIPWYIMTSKPTRNATEEYFQQNEYFGLDPKNITFFNQGTLPAFDLDGKKLVMDSPTSLVQSPDGNGGLYRAIKDNNLVEDFEKRNIKHLYMYCVDNVLSLVADPTFIGYAMHHNFELATKAVRKRDAHESVGLIATKNNHPCVIEYSEISKDLAEATDDQGLLKLRAANIVNHYYSTSLLKRELANWCENLQYHIAKKKIPSYDAISKQYTKPETPNGIKLEQFIFDVFPTIPLEKFGCLEVQRSKEFSPLKNGPGSANDNPETSRTAYMELGTSWLTSAGSNVRENVLVEVSSATSYKGENLTQFKDVLFDTSDVYVE
ncbi:hypothetical protein RNJ44_04532 [Nakaseomyces bracarensis]|uniref:UDP-N-acetylglucosamine diphosphorylase n=1 Tax=Nakaseomyces bracarensis TaxID=273131 RepID=A0ABR4NV58_9SACH